MTNDHSPRIKREVMVLNSTFRNHEPMYHHPVDLIWFRPPHFPWLLVDMQPENSRPAA